AAVAIHAGANLANDYYDHVRGADTPESIGPSGVIQHGLLRPRTVLRGAFACFAVAGILGLLLIASRGWPILLIGVLSVGAGYAYTGRPIPLGAVGLGAGVVLVCRGLVGAPGDAFLQRATNPNRGLWADGRLG